MNQATETSVGATTAGTAFGSLVGVGLCALTGLNPETAIPLTATLGAFTFGRIFPR